MAAVFCLCSALSWGYSVAESEELEVEAPGRGHRHLEMLWMGCCGTQSAAPRAAPYHRDQPGFPNEVRMGSCGAYLRCSQAAHTEQRSTAMPSVTKVKPANGGCTTAREESEA